MRWLRKTRLLAGVFAGLCVSVPLSHTILQGYPAIAFGAITAAIVIHTLEETDT